ncbi:hypothetical protein NU195Hw_g4768t1 [Hortaea werneckii]
MRTKVDLLKLAALLLAAARVEAQSGYVELCTVQVYQTCGTPTLTTTLSFPQSVSYAGNTTSTIAASSSGGCSTCSTSSSVSSYIEPSVPASSTSIVPPPVSTTPVLSTSGSVTFTSTPSPSSSSSSLVSSSVPSSSSSSVGPPPIYTPPPVLSVSSSVTFTSTPSPITSSSSEAPPPVYTPPPVLSTSSSVTFTSTPSPITSSSSESPPPVYTPPPVLSTSSGVTYTSTPSPSTSSSSEAPPPIYTPPPVLSTSSSVTFTSTPSPITSSSSQAPPPIYTPPEVLSTSSDVTFTSTPSPILSSSSSEEPPPIYTPPPVLSTSSGITFTSTPSPSSSLLSSSSSSSVGVPPIYTPPTVISISSTSTATPAPSCTNGIETDADGVQYEVQCGSDTTGGNQGTPYGTSNRVTSYRDCFGICNDTPNCQGFVWVGAQGSYGNGPGTCYFKGTGDPGQEITFVPGTDSSHVACIIPNPAPPATSTSSSTATVSSTSVGEPPIYTPPAEIFTTTTTTTSTSSSSSVESPPIYSPPVQPTTTTTTTTTSTTSTSSSSEVPPIYTPPQQPTTTTTTSTTTTSTSSSSEVPPIYTSPPQQTTTTTTTTTSSSSSSSAPAVPSCPYAADTIITDDNGIDYTVRCNADTTGGGVGNLYSTTNSANSFQECFTVCDGYPTCQGFVWLGAANSYGSGAGNCYFKGADPGQTIAFTNSDSAHFAAIKVNQNGPAVYPVTTTTTTTTTSSSSSVDIFVPTTTTTTTTTTSSSSSSTITSRVIYTPPPPSQISTSVSSTTSITFTSQPARLSCARQGYLVQNFNWFVVEIATGNTVQNGSIQGGIPMQAMGYNRCDGLIYATDQQAHLVRFGLDLTPQRLYEQTFFRYQTGEVDNDCQYWAIRTADNDVARWIHVDVNPASPVYGTIVGQGELAVPQYFYADWAYVPGAGSYLWSVGIDQPTGYAYLYRFDQATLTSIIVASFGDIGLTGWIPDPASGYRLNFGAVYASADGFLYGSENISGNIYRFTVTEPYNWQFLVQGPGTVQNDGARCIDNTEAIGTY